MQARVDGTLLYEVYFDRFYDWMLEQGKSPRKDKGLSENTAGNYVERLDQIHRKVWDEGIEPDLISPNQATLFVDKLNEDDVTKKDGEPYSEDGKRKFVNTLQKYALWKEYEEQDDGWAEWEPPVVFSQDSYKGSDIFSFEEFGKLPKAAKQLEKLPDYDEASEKKRERINRRLAQRFGKPMEQIGPADWNHEASGAKIPSLVLTAMDTGLPPIEVQRATIDWIDFDEGKLDIPEDQTAKDREESNLVLTDETLEYLRQWEQERQQYEKYEDTDALWLNDDGNRYQSRTLNDLLKKLCEQAGIPHSDRKITWYSIRRSFGTYIKAYEGLDMASDLLRHGHLDTTREHYAEEIQEIQKQTIEEVHEVNESLAEGELSMKEVVALYRSDNDLLRKILREARENGLLDDVLSVS